MRLKEFDYFLPKNLIAQNPMKPRDHSRLLVLEKKTGKIEHKHFYDIIDYFKKGDVLILNNSKVFPARLVGRRKGTGGKVEVFLLRYLTSQSPLLIRRGGERAKRTRGEVWQCLVGGPRRKTGLTVEFGGGLRGEIIADNQDGTWLVKFNKAGKALMRVVDKIGLTPLPPYIKRELKVESKKLKVINDVDNYQTVYADERKIGSVAAPTAGLHFTPTLLNKIKKKGVQIEYITLHVGLGTFAPVKVDDITKHKMHAEYVEIGKDVISGIIKAKQEGRRIIAVGTTCVRALEAAFGVIASPARSGAKQSREQCKMARDPSLRFAPLRMTGWAGWVDIFIYPGYKFKVIDAMITNFHLPKSTLLMLVTAFACARPSRNAGKKNIDRAYKNAIKRKYRFYSYGDAMFIY